MEVARIAFRPQVGSSPPGVAASTLISVHPRPSVVLSGARLGCPAARGHFQAFVSVSALLRSRLREQVEVASRVAESPRRKVRIANQEPMGSSSADGVLFYHLPCWHGLGGTVTACASQTRACSAIAWSFRRARLKLRLPSGKERVARWGISRASDGQWHLCQ